MGSFSVLNNISGINAQNQLNLNNVNLSRTLSRLSSGKRISTGADDAAGLQIADSLNANVYALNQSIRNANDGIGVAQIADGALQEMSNLLTRGVTLAEEAATETVDANGKASLQAEFTSIQAEIARIATQTNFNGAYLFTPAGLGGDGKLSVFVGDMSSSSTIDLSIASITADATKGTVTALGTTDLTKVDLTKDAAGALTNIQAALNTVAGMRGTIGAGMNRLQSAVSVLQTQVQNTQSAESTIRDANMAQEISNLTKEQILAQSGMAALAQANSQSQNVLTLLKNA
ncbi:MAG TPA: flagellin [Acidobacteriota bacterium]|nr:flagellin [Acidobacteriota bacterium]